MQEVNFYPINGRRELRIRIKKRLASSPVVSCLPVLAKLLKCHERDTLGPISDCLLVRPAGQTKTRLQVVESGLGDGQLERVDRTGRWQGHGLDTYFKDQPSFLRTLISLMHGNSANDIITMLLTMRRKSNRFDDT